MALKKPDIYKDVEKCADDILRKVGKDIVFGMPLALGKPNQLINEIYRRAKEDPSISLRIIITLIKL